MSFLHSSKIRFSSSQKDKSRNKSQPSSIESISIAWRDFTISREVSCFRDLHSMWQPLPRPASGKFNFRDATKACVDDTCFDRSSLCSLYLQLFKPRLLLKRPRDVSINFHRQRFNYRDNWLDELHDTMHNNFLIEIAIWRLGDLLCFRCNFIFRTDVDVIMDEQLA